MNKTFPVSSGNSQCSGIDRFFFHCLKKHLRAGDIAQGYGTCLASDPSVMGVGQRREERKYLAGGWGDTSFSRVLAFQAWESEFHSQNPCKKATHGGVHLYSYRWGNRDKLNPGTYRSASQPNSQTKCQANKRPYLKKQGKQFPRNNT